LGDLVYQIVAYIEQFPGRERLDPTVVDLDLLGFSPESAGYRRFHENKQFGIGRH